MMNSFAIIFAFALLFCAMQGLVHFRNGADKKALIWAGVSLLIGVALGFVIRA